MIRYSAHALQFISGMRLSKIVVTGLILFGFSFAQAQEKEQEVREARVKAFSCKATLSGVDLGGNNRVSIPMPQAPSTPILVSKSFEYAENQRRLTVDLRSYFADESRNPMIRASVGFGELQNGEFVEKGFGEGAIQVYDLSQDTAFESHIHSPSIDFPDITLECSVKMVPVSQLSQAVEPAKNLKFKTPKKPGKSKRKKK